MKLQTEKCVLSRRQIASGVHRICFDYCRCVPACHLEFVRESFEGHDCSDVVGHVDWNPGLWLVTYHWTGHIP